MSYQEQLLGTEYTEKELLEMLSKGGRSRTIAALALGAEKHLAMGASVEIMDDAIYYTDPIWGRRLLVTESVSMLTRLIIDDDELDRARKFSTPFKETELPLAVVLPLDYCGQWITRMVQTKDMEALVVPIPPLTSLVRRTPELLGSRLQGYMLAHPLFGMYIELCNRLTEPGPERFRFEKCWAIGKRAGILQKLYPRQFKVKDRTITSWGELLKLLLGKDGLFRKLRDIRVPGGASFILSSEPDIGWDCCKVPRRWADRMKLEIGDPILVMRRPVCVPDMVTIQGWTQKTFALNPVRVKQALLSDCDGDLVQIIPAKGMDMEDIHQTVLLDQKENSMPELGEITDPVDYAGSDYTDTLKTLCNNKLLMGPVTALRYRASLHNEFRSVWLGLVEFNESPYELQLGRKLVRTEIPLSAYEDLLHKLAEQTVNKHQTSVSMQSILDLLDLASTEPFLAWQKLMQQGGHIAANPDRLAEWCQYLATLPVKFTVYLDSLPTARALHESPSQQDLEGVLNVLDAQSFETY